MFCLPFKNVAFTSEYDLKNTKLCFSFQVLSILFPFFHTSRFLWNFLKSLWILLYRLPVLKEPVIKWWENSRETQLIRREARNSYFWHRVVFVCVSESSQTLSSNIISVCFYLQGGVLTFYNFIFLSWREAPGIAEFRKFALLDFLSKFLPP